MKHIAFVTDNEHTDYTPDDGLAAAELQRRGVHVSAAVWDDPAVNWSSFDLVVIRTTWDYFCRLPEFLAWLNRIEAQNVPLWNPVALIRWNSDKRYLPELAAQGIELVPTAWFARGTAVDLAAELARHGWKNAVIKPTVSGGARRTWQITVSSTDLDQARLDEILTESDAMLQPFVEQIAAEGEWSFLFFDRQFSHALIKRAQPGDFRVQRQFGGQAIPVPAPPEALLKQAARVLDAVDSPLLYARVDGVNVNGTFWLMELEIIEPVLFLGTAAHAPLRFAEAIQRRL